MKKAILILLCGALGAWAAEDTNEALHLPPHPVAEATPNQVVIKGGTLWTMESQGTIQADILLEDGKIKRIAKSIRAPKNAYVIDASGKHVTPGIIDAHSHTAVEGFGVNEASDTVTAQVRIEDVLDPWDNYIYLQLAGGLTAANILHGSANAIGGQSAIVKWRWGVNRPKDLLIEDAPGIIKFALGENVKRSNFNFPGAPRRYPTTRMGVEAAIRDTFNRAVDYRAEWERYNGMSEEAQKRTEPPRRDLQLDAIVEVLNGSRMIHSHGYRQDEFLALMHIIDDFDIKNVTFQHILEGYKIADEMAKRGIMASTFSDWWAFKIEAYDAIPYNAALMEERGVIATMNSDDGTLARRLNIEGAKAMRYGGVSAENALAMVTINAAIQMGLQDRMGSLKKGKDADVVVWTGDPTSIYSSVDYTIVDGQIYFSRELDAAHREKVSAARATLAKMIKDGKKKDKKEDKSESDESKEQSEAKEGGSEKAEESEKDSEEKKEETKPVKPLPKLEYVMDPLSAGTHAAIKGATVHTLAGDAIENGVVVIKDGKITAVGGSDTAIPSGAEVYDASGKHLWPGLIHAYSQVGLIEIASVSGTEDRSEKGDWNANIHAHKAFHPDSAHVPVARNAGLTHVFTIATGGMVTGTGSIMRTQGWTWEDMGAAPGFMMGIQWPEGRSGGGFASFFGGGKSLADRKKDAEKRVKEMTQFFDDARLYHKAKDNHDAAKHGAWKTDRQFEEMKPVLDGKRPLYIMAEADWAIKAAVKWVGEQDLSCVIVGAENASRIADWLAEHKVPVILGSAVADPDRDDEPFDIAYTTPNTLAKAGVSFAIAGIGANGNRGADTRGLIEHAGFAAAHGLDRQEAYKSVTLYPAQILGMGDVLGSIEVGKSASLVLTDGDLLEPKAPVVQVWIDGVKSDMMDKHKRLYERYRNRPKPTGAR